MIKLIASLILLLVGFSTYSQSEQTEPPALRELGLRFSGFDDFNLFYKKQLADGAYRRHRFLIGRIAYNSNRSDVDFNLGYAIGKEKRKPITEKLSFLYGLEFSFSFAYSNSESALGDRNNQFLITPALGYIIGFQLYLSEACSISAEVIPSLSTNLAIYDYTENQYKVEANLNSNATALSLMYKF